MIQWEYCEVDFDGSITWVYFYDEAGDYIDRPTKHPRLGVMLAQLGHQGWEIISSWWRSDRKVTYMMKRPSSKEWTAADTEQAKAAFARNHPRDRV